MNDIIGHKWIEPKLETLHARKYLGHKRDSFLYIIRSISK